MDWTTLVAQIPFLAAFIWFSLESQKRYQSSMEIRDKAYLDAINKVSDRLDHHDEVSQANHNEIKQAVMVERATKPKNDR